MSQQRRMRFYARAGSETPYVATEADGALYLIRTRDQNVGRSLFVNQARGEMHVLARVVALLTAALGEDAVRGRTFVDVGANIGTTTLPAVLRHGFAQAIAFEPEPHNLLDLRLNALLNGVEDRVRAVGTALSDATGASNLVVDLEQGGKHWIAVDRKRLELANRRSADVIRVETTTVDDLVAEGQIDPDAVGLVWIDAQAHEGHILNGARSLAERGIPVALEWAPHALDRLGDRTKIARVAGEHYTHFLDLRASIADATPDSGLCSAADLGRHAERDEVTDLLLLRLSERQAGALDVGGILATATASSPDGASLRHLAAELSDPGRKPTPHEPIDGAKRRRRRSRPQAAR